MNRDCSHRGDSVAVAAARVSGIEGSAPALHPIVIRFGRLGDTVMLSPLLHLLRRRYGMPCWLIGSGPWSTELYRGHADVARIWSLRGRHTPLLLGPTWWRVLWALRHSGKSPIYVCETQAFQQLNRIKAALALAGVAPERCVFLSDENVGEAAEHRVDNVLNFGKQTPASLSAADYPWTQVEPAPRLEALEEERIERDAWIRTRGWLGRPIVLVQPGNRRTMRQNLLRRNRVDDKAWSVSNWCALLKCVHKSLPEAQIMLCGSQQEMTMLRRIRDLTGLDSVAAVQLPLSRLIALCEIAHSTISVDTGPAHVAAAMGSPLVVLFGNTSLRHWLPRSLSGATVIGLGGSPNVRHVDQISVQSVFEAWRSLPARISAA